MSATRASNAPDADARDEARMLREARLKASAARLSVAAAAFLIVLKSATGWLTGSISVWGSLSDPTMAIFQSVVIPVSGIFLIREAVRRIMTPHETALEWVGVGTMAVAGAVSVALVARLRKVAKETDSPALAADSVHYATDVFTNGAALVALLVVALTGWTLADPLFSIAISAFILLSAFEVARDAVNVLMDRRLGPEVDAAVAAIIASFRDRGVTGFHNLRTRRSGSLKFIDLHLEVTADKSFVRAHDLTERVIRAIEKEIPRSRVQIHTDPAE